MGLLTYIFAAHVTALCYSVMLAAIIMKLVDFDITKSALEIFMVSVLILYVIMASAFCTVTVFTHALGYL